MATTTPTQIYTSAPTERDVINAANAKAGVPLAAYSTGGGMSGDQGLKNVPSGTYTTNQGGLVTVGAPTTGGISNTISGANKVNTTSNVAPVINAQMAQNDYTAKYNALQQALAGMNQQQNTQAQQQQQQKIDQANKDVQTSETNLKQQGLDVQKTQADAAKTAADAKLQATSSLTGQLAGAQNQLTEAQGAGYTGNQPIQYDTAGKVIPNVTPQVGGELQPSQNTLNYVQQLQGMQDERTTALNTFLQTSQNMIIGLQNSEAALVNATTQQYQGIIEAQRVANASQVGQATQANARAGQEYAPTQAGSTLANVIAQGNMKLSEINSQMATTISTLQNNFAKEQYDMMNKNFDALDKHFQDRMATFKDVHDAVAQDAATQQKAQQTALENKQREMENAVSIAGQYDTYKKEQIANGKTPIAAGDYIAAQKYKDAYNSALASEKAKAAVEKTSGTTYDENGNVIAVGNLSTLDINRYNLAATRATKTFRDSMVFKSAQNAEFYLSKLKAANENVGSIGDQEILDSISQFNTGGGRVTEAQVNIILKGKSINDTVNSWGNKLKTGGVLSPKQREEALKLATATAENFQENYKTKYDNLAGNLNKQKIPQEFWGIPTPEQLKGEVSGASVNDSPEKIVEKADSSIVNFGLVSPQNQAILDNLYANPKAKGWSSVDIMETLKAKGLIK